MTTLSVLAAAQSPANRRPDWSQRENDIFWAAVRERHDEICDGEDCHHYENRED